MHFLLGLSWLIPAFPFFGAMLVGILLLFFSRTIDRLTKPVSFIIITCTAISTLLSLTLYLQHETGDVIDFTILNQHVSLFLDNFSATILTLSDFIVLIIMLYSFYKLPRANGYVRYFVLLGISSSLLLFSILATDIPQSLASNFIN